MKKLIITIIIISGILIQSNIYAQWTNGQDAAFVIGQADFTSANYSVSDSTLYFASDIAIDEANGKLYIADNHNNRILRFSYPVMEDQPKAEYVFGQSGFHSNGINGGGSVSSTSFYWPSGIFVDNTGRLWIADKYNNRVVWFNNANIENASNPTADGVLGQANFNSGNPNRGGSTAQNSLYQPSFVFVDENGNLFVADTKNNRVLRFNNAAGKPNGANADGVLGQGNFTSNSAGCNNNTVNNPYGLTCINGNLFVSDKNNHRVLKFANAQNKPNGANADAVLGQVSYTANSSGCSQNKMKNPLGLTSDNNGSLYVSDYGNNRILIFENAIALQSGANAGFVIGQTNFISGSSGLSQSKLHSPYGIDCAENSSYLFVADYLNNRIMQFGSNITPVVFTQDTELVGANITICGGTVISQGSSPVTERGICWDIQTSPTVILPTRTYDGSGLGDFTSILNGLSPNTTYYYRAYAINSSDTVYGNEIQFTTLSQSVMEVLIIEVELSECSSATVNSIVTSDGGSPVLIRGVCWDINPDPTISLSTKTTNGSGTGQYQSLVDGLASNQVYYIRAYATNANGTTYSDNHSITSIASEFAYLNHNNVDSTTVSLSCDVNPNGIVTIVTFEYDTSALFNTAQLTEPDTITGNNFINSTAEISGLVPYKQYYYRAKASNSVCYSLSEENTFTTRANINITSPQADTSWQIGRAYNIRWTNIGDPLVKLEYNIDDKSNWNLIAENIPATQNYHNWIVPDSMSSYCKIRISDGAGYMYDVTESFVIENPVVYSGINFTFGHDPQSPFGFHPSNPENAFEEGRIVRFKVSVSSSYNFEILTVTGKIETACPWFSITKDFATFNNISGSRESWDYYEIELANDLPDFYEIYFKLTIFDELLHNDPFTSYSDTLTAIDPFKFSMVVIDDDEFPDSYGNNNGIVNPGESIEIVPMINNTMDYDFSGVNGKLICHHPDVSIWHSSIGSGINHNIFNNYSYGYINENFNYVSGIPGLQINAMPVRDYVFSFNGVQETSIEFEIVITGSCSGVTLIPGLNTWSVTFTINDGYLPYYPNVWPGDANNDFMVDGRDIFPIGIHYGERGIPRDIISSLWMAHNSSDWERLQYNLMNLKFADCNGDSIIDASDVVVIDSNYNNTHFKHVKSSKNFATYGPEVYLISYESEFRKGETFSVELHAGTQEMPVKELYGFIANLVYDPEFIISSSVNIKFPQSWLYTSPENILSFSKNFEQCVLEAGLVRNNQISSSGYGKIAEISFAPKAEFGIELLQELIIISQIDAISKNGEPIELMINNQIDRKYSTKEADIIAFPNPTRGELNIVLPYLESNAKLSVIDLNGKIMYETEIDKASSSQLLSINLSGLWNGIYILKLVNNSLSTHKKIYIQ